MRVSLFGATGSTGVELLRRLTATATVRCLVRSPEKLPEERRIGADRKMRNESP